MLTFDYLKYMGDATEVLVREKAIQTFEEEFTTFRHELQGDQIRLAEWQAQKGEAVDQKMLTLQEELDGREAWLTQHESDLQVEVEKCQTLKKTVNERRQWLVNCGQPDPAEKLVLVEKGKEGE